MLVFPLLELETISVSLQHHASANWEGLCDQQSFKKRRQKISFRNNAFLELCYAFVMQIDPIIHSSHEMLYHIAKSD